ncbi:imidazole glycerol phosphate synthase subunit HisH [Nitrosomonas sp. ANs5]|uniref:imidazole glycerol phosphate synthase subunit HisH n=1 Tax=Nitrosomonas sp. ANs5 TaxID=3423941 RepID=UPI003D3464BA
MNTIAIVDYGMGNLRSVSKALEYVAPSATVTVTSDPAIIRQASRIVVPGQGAMPHCMQALADHGLRQAILDAAENKPFLGICLGLQMLFEVSEEGDAQGLGMLPGHVRKFRFDTTADTGVQKLKVPHMGWNQVHQAADHPLWHEIADDARFYFVHSYFVVASEQEIIAGTTCYPTPFTCAIAKDNIFAVQFHPEKSNLAGLTLLRNFTQWMP